LATATGALFDLGQINNRKDYFYMLSHHPRKPGQVVMHHDIQHIDIQHIDTQHKGLICDTQLKCHSVLQHFKSSANMLSVTNKP
jgi:hypothetical protein